MIAFLYAGIVIAFFIVLEIILCKVKKRRHKIKEIEVGDWAGFEDYYNLTPMDIIILENNLVVNERIDCQTY